MADKKSKTEKMEKEYVIPLRERCRPVPRYKKTPKAIKTVKEFLARHMKVYDRDLNKIKLDKYTNEFLWARGIKNPPHKVKVKAVKEGDIVRVSLVDLPNKLKFKKIREEKASAKASEAAAKKKTLAEKAQDIASGKDVPKKQTAEDKVEESEKQESVKEEGEKIQEEKAKAEKQTTKPEKSKANSAKDSKTN